MKEIAFMVAWAAMGYASVQSGYLDRPNAILMIVSALGIAVAQNGYPVISMSIILFFILLEVIMKKTKKAKFEYTEEFESIYQKQKDLLAKEYRENQKNLQTYIITFLALIVGFMCISVILQNFDKMSPDWKIGIKYVLFMAVLVIQYICVSKIAKIQLTNRKIYENHLLPIFISNIDNNLKYEKKMPATNRYIEQRYIDSGIENKKYDVFKCEDFVIRRIRWCNTF